MLIDGKQQQHLHLKVFIENVLLSQNIIFFIKVVSIVKTNLKLFSFLFWEKNQNYRRKIDTNDWVLYFKIIWLMILTKTKWSNPCKISVLTVDQIFFHSVFKLILDSKFF